MFGSEHFTTFTAGKVGVVISSAQKEKNCMSYGYCSGLNRNDLHIFECLVISGWHHLTGIKEYGLDGRSMPLLGVLLDFKYSSQTQCLFLPAAMPYLSTCCHDSHHDNNGING